MTGRGVFVAFEGGEACGKSTQAARLAARRNAVLTREPGGTALGERVRAIFLDPATGHVDGRAEALLVAAARAQHVAEVIEPALAAGRDVVTDRFTGSSLAYQGHGRGLPVEEVRRLSAFASAGLEPDLYVLLDVPADVAAVRLGEDRDRMESAGDDFHDRVRRGYAELARTEGWVVVDGTGTPDEVEAAVFEAVSGRLHR
ncbi:MAG: dTMP kinase [Acidimicrobiales bacterium]|nr:dTMP kinase [Acidimicrobiales bacterium]